MILCILTILLLVAIIVVSYCACKKYKEGYLNLPGEPSPPVGALTNMTVMGQGHCSPVDGKDKIVVTHGRGTVLKNGGYCVAGAWPSLHPGRVTVYSANPFCKENLKSIGQ